MSTTERLKEYLEYRQIPVSRAEKACGFGNATLVSAFKNPSASLGSRQLESFLSVYTELSAEWLLRGVGSMLLDDRQQSGGENNKYFVICKLLLENRQKDNELYSELAKLMSK